MFLYIDKSTRKIFIKSLYNKGFIVQLEAVFLKMVYYRVFLMMASHLPFSLHNACSQLHPLHVQSQDV